MESQLIARSIFEVNATSSVFENEEGNDSQLTNKILLLENFSEDENKIREFSQVLFFLFSHK